MTGQAANLNRSVKLVEELKTLRRGLGVQSGQSSTRIGKILRSLCAIADEDGSARALEKVAAWLKDEARRLSPIHQRCIEGAFGIDQDAQFALYKLRAEWVADQIGRSIRTARRYVDQAIDELADNASRMSVRKVVGIRQYLNQQANIEYWTHGMNDTDVTVLRGRIIAIAREIDISNRYVAIVVADEHTPVAIPIDRVCNVVPVAANIVIADVRRGVRDD